MNIQHRVARKLAWFDFYEFKKSPNAKEMLKQDKYLAQAQTLIEMVCMERCWLPMDSAPKDGTPVLLFLDPPIDTNDVCGWVTPAKISMVVGWVSGNLQRGKFEWGCGYTEEGSADTEGNCGSPYNYSINPVGWMPLPVEMMG